MSSTQPFRIALAIAAMFVCSGIAHAQDVNSSWLLRAPQIASRYGLDPSAARIDLKPSQSPQTPNPNGSPSASGIPSTPDRNSVIYDEPVEHRFWGATNDLLFAGVGASRTLDYFSTLNMRRRGRQEILLTNDVVDNHAAFAVIEAAGTGASIGVSYLFHHYGHHKLERATSIVHIGLATTGAVRNYCLKTAHPATASPVSAILPVVPSLVPSTGAS
jgi:hypothetical protein